VGRAAIPWQGIDLATRMGQDAEGEGMVTGRSGSVAPAGNFGARLRWWRERRGLSQLALASAADTPQRHVSFLESGRAAPSREMILRLAAVLDLPLRQQNTLFLAAGYALAWRESDLSAPELARVDSALDYMLAQGRQRHRGRARRRHGRRSGLPRQPRGDRASLDRPVQRRDALRFEEVGGALSDVT
jgi:transcriptional regulator with XRE-family HTH domain